VAVQYPEFVDNAQFIQMDSSVSETEQLKAMLNNLTRVHGLTANKFDSLSDLIHQYLKCGCEIFGLETGIVSEIDNQESYHILDIISPIEVLHKGQQFPLENTYCREVYKNQTVLGFPEVGNLEFMNCHPVYINLKLEAYLSAPIYVEDKLFGTLNFTSTQARPNGFSKNEHNLILLMANSIGNYIQLRNNNERLEELNERIMRFVGFVTHDLRNPIGAVLALSQLAQRQIGDEAKLMSMLPKISEVAEDSLELINHILDTTALSTGKLHVELEPVNFEEVVGAAINAVLDFSRENRVSIKTEFSGLATAYCDAKRIQQTRWIRTLKTITSKVFMIPSALA